MRIDAQDDLAADNQASIVSLLPAPVKVKLVSHGNRFLEKALRAAGQRGFDRGRATAPIAAEDFDLVVLDDVTPAVWPKRQSAGHSCGQFQLVRHRLDHRGAPTAVDWKNTHPLLRYINLDNVQISETLGVKTPSWAAALVEAQQTPLILAGELSRQKIVWIGFDTLQSTWPLRISFPMFIANAVEWLNPQAAKSGQLMVHGGRAVPLPLTQAAATAEVTMPDGTKRTLTPGDAREIVFGETGKQGIYRLRVRHQRSDVLRQRAGRGGKQHQAAGGIGVREVQHDQRHVGKAVQHGPVAVDCRRRAGRADVRVVVLPSEDGVRKVTQGRRRA